MIIDHEPPGPDCEIEIRMPGAFATIFPDLGDKVIL